MTGAASGYGPIGFHSIGLAPRWEDGMTVGTGELGVLVHGDPIEHVFDMSHEEGFFPLNERPKAPLIAPRLDEVRALVMNGSVSEAALVVKECSAASGYGDDFVWTDPFLPLAQVRWRPERAEGFDSYRRECDFATGRTVLSWSHGDSLHRISLEPDRAASQITVSIWASHGVRGTVLISSGSSRALQGSVTAVDYSSLVSTTVIPDDDRVQVTTTPVEVTPDSAGWSARASIEFDRFCSVRDTDDEHTVTLDLDVPPGTATQLKLSGRLPTIPAPVELPVATASHIDLVSRCSLDLDVPQGYREMSTESLFHRARRLGDPVAARALIELAFAAGRHTIVSSSATLPPNLVGVWQGTWAPAWSGDYTINGNVECGTVASMVSTGTPELLLGLFRLIDRFAADYRENAARIFAAEGFFLPARLTTHGRVNHFSEEYPHEFWIGGGAWILRLAHDYFSTTGDLRFLTGWAWPFAKEVVRFAETVVFARGAGDHVVPSYSAENTPEGAANPLTMDAAGDVAALRDAYLMATRFARIVGETEPVDHWLSLRDRLPEYRIAVDGTLAEWIAPGTPENHSHRHATQLHPFMYEGDERAGDPSVRRAALSLIRAKLRWRENAPSQPPGNMEMAFGLVQLGSSAAHLGDAESAYRSALWLAREHFRPSMMSTHDAGAIFNADASGGLPAVIASMLVQTTPECLRIMPAVPDDWPQGTVRGLTGRGGLIVDELRWSLNEVVAVVRRRAGSDAARESDLLTVVPPPGFVLRGGAADRLVGEHPQTIAFSRGEERGWCNAKSMVP